MEVSDTAKTTGSYGFKQTPDCGYEQVITISDAPSFVTHDEVARTFMIEPTQDSDVGEHTVTVSSSILVPDDASMSSFTEWNKSFSFTIEVEPEEVCVPQYLYLDKSMGSVEYFIGSTATASKTYDFI